MNSYIVKFIIQCIVLVVAIIAAIFQHELDSKRKKIIFVAAILTAIGTFVSFLFTNDLPAPRIDREPDYSSIILSTDEPMKIEYRISTNGTSSDEWIKYEGPFKLERNAVIYARANTLWYTSEQIHRDVYVAENSLVYFGRADEPGDSIVDIKANYHYKDATVSGETSNHYVGYKIKKSDITVVGTDLNGNEKEIVDFTYSPAVLKAGKNTVEVMYTIADDIVVNDYIYINGEVPTMIDLDAKHKGGNIYFDTLLDSNDFIVKATYEDGTVKVITGCSISPSEVKEGKNKITITKDGLSGIKEAITAAYPQTEYQRCIVHQVRNTLKYVPDKDRKSFATDLKTIYHAPSEEQARNALDRVHEKWTPKYPNSMKRWFDNWDAISPIFKFSTDVRKVIYTTNAIESLNSTYRKLNRQRSVFPSDTALLKALYLATFEATKKWTTTIRNWAKVYGELSIMYEGRLPE